MRGLVRPWVRPSVQPSGRAVGRALAGVSVVPAIALIVATLVFTGCAGKAPKETKLKSDIVAGELLNPNRRGTPQPVKLHVYYLKQDEAFLQANFNQLIQPEASSIAGDLIRRTEALVGPGETRSIDAKFDKQTRFIGAVAEFTKIDEANWRALVAVPGSSWNPFKGRKLKISLDDLSVDCAIVKD